MTKSCNPDEVAAEATEPGQWVRERPAVLSESEQWFADILHFLPDPLLAIDKVGKVTAWNPAIEEMTGVKAEAILGKGDYEYALPFYQERRPILIDLALLPCEVVEERYAHICREGDVLLAEAVMPGGGCLTEKASVLRNSQGEIIGAIESLRDTTEQRRMAEALQRSTKEAEERHRELLELNERLKGADAMKSVFLSTVSHELRTPLTSVIGFAKIVRKKVDDQVLPAIDAENKKALRVTSQIRDNLDIIIAEGQRLTFLINDVLDLAKMEAGMVEWRREPVEVAEVIGHALSATRALFHQRGLDLVTDIEEGLPPILGVRDRLIQVLVNLVANAVKFTEEGTVTCRAVRGRNEIILSVIDSGTGIAPEDQPLVFEKFKQVGDTLTNKPKGVGLGLSICKQIVEYHDGRIWVESEPGEGSSFFVALPLVAERGQTESGALLRHLREHVLTAVHSMLDSVYATVEKIHANIEAEKVSILAGRKRELRNIVLVVESHLRDILQQARAGMLPEEEAKQRVLSEMRALSYGNDDYIYVSDFSSVLISHPDPRINGADFSQVKDIHGNLVIPPLVDLARKEGEGYHGYWWRRLDSDAPCEKLAYGKVIPEWQWVIVTGVYIDDIELEARRRREREIEQLRHSLRKMKIARTGFIYIFDSTFTMIIHPNPNIEGTNIESLVNPLTNESLFHELIRASRMPDYKHVYKWDKPEDPGNYIYDKIAWVRYAKGFDWYICSSVYVEELYENA
jgi:PAS domain S-box-containing protein